MKNKIKKIGITGAMGFLASHTIDNLLDKGYGITFFDRHYDESKIEEYGWKGKIDIRIGDMKDRDAVFDFVNHTDAVINFAGLLGTQEMLENMTEAVKVNILGAINVFDAIKLYKKRGLQMAVGNHWMLNPYSITRTTTENFAFMYNREHDTDIRVLRAMNVYGERQLKEPVKKLFPNVVIPALLNEDIILYGTGEQIIDLVYSADVAEIISRLILYDDIPGNVAFEAGVNGNRTLNESVEEIIELVGSSSKIQHVPMRPGEDQTSVVQITKEGFENLEKYLDFSKTDFTPRKQAIQKTIEWYRQNLHQFE
jgi:UDP-glucose 4-epimerase